MIPIRSIAKHLIRSKFKIVLNSYRTTHSHGTKQACNKPYTTLMEPACKVAVITGGTEGIGFATAHQLLCCKAKHVALLDQDIPKGFEAVNHLNCSHGKNKATFIKCDVSNKEAVDDTFLKLKNEFETVDIIVNAAGLWDETKWQQELQTNLVGTINVNLAVQQCFESSNAVVINLAGLSGLQPSSCSPINSAEYAGIVRLSQSLGHQANFKRKGVRVVALCVGLTSTNFIKDVHLRMLTAEMGKELQEEMKTALCQKAEAGARAVLELVRRAKTGSVWVVEGSRLLHVEMADWRKSFTLESQFT
ncbi:unnamed protein product [Phaedon cochleariae]|uniref:Uncharacterized protein n=1 Tax=Phaedon cochleariae TaxID=80249 RepID=A0A9P0DNH4_PHACE|nr:unnamed protein product [Phaedon cochleariae]